MNTQLISVFNGTISNETTLLCNARDLHAFLGIKKVFAAWITNRISEYEFVENQDYILLSKIGKQTSGRGGHNRKDYHLTLDTAKELAMVERNEKGRQIRRYFIECEKQLNQGNGSTVLTTPMQRTPLRDAVNLLVGMRGMTFQEAYQLIHQRFGVSSIEQLTRAQVMDAIEYIHCLLVDGETGKLPSGESRILITFRNGEIIRTRAIGADEHVATLEAFIELARCAHYIVIHKDDAAPLMKALTGGGTVERKTHKLNNYSICDF